MVPTTPTPSTRLLRAADAERADLRRHREKLLRAQESLRAELQRIEASLEAVRERESLLDRLTGPDPSSATPVVVPRSSTAENGARDLLRGPSIRRKAVEVLLGQPDRPEALHYRQWFELIAQAGFEVAGKDPLAVFLTQLSRSPVVRRSTQSGVYELDRAAPLRLRQQLARLDDELRGLASKPSETTNLAAIRSRRAELTAEIGRVEKAVEEAEEVLSQARDPQPLAHAS
jgi:hypothetical protein